MHLPLVLVPLLHLVQISTIYIPGFLADSPWPVRVLFERLQVVLVLRYEFLVGDVSSAILSLEVPHWACVRDELELGCILAVRATFVLFGIRRVANGAVSIGGLLITYLAAGYAA